MNKLAAVVVSALVALPVGVYAGGRLKGHPNMQAASKALDTAWGKITAAQQANEYDLGGHAAKAKDAIKLAIDELKLAADKSNENRSK